MPLKITFDMKFIILDRDGTIIEDGGYLHKIEDLKFLPGAIDGLKKFRDSGSKFIIVTNQAGLARGKFSIKQLDDFNNELIYRLNTEDIKIEKIYHCLHHPQLTGPCECRKPETKMVQMASEEFGFNPADCIYIGDKDSDIQLGKNCEGTTVLIENGQYPSGFPGYFKAKNLEEAFDLLRASRII